MQYTEETTVKTENNMEIAWDAFGNKADPAVLLVMGLGSQMIVWDEAFCKAIAAQGFYVIRFDNRDVGLSTKFEQAPVPNPLELLQAAQSGEALDVPYLLLDMAKDVIGLLDALKIEKAHVVGASMGGMIAQELAIRFPERFLSLTSIMSAPSPTLDAQPEAQAILITTPPDNREEYIENSIETWKILQGSTFPIDEAFIRERAGRVFDRSYYPQGTGRQMAAIIASGDRTEALKEVKIPTLVIHGSTDPLVSVKGGEATADAIPGAELLIVEGMGHSIPTQVAPQIIETIVTLLKKAG